MTTQVQLAHLKKAFLDQFKQAGNVTAAARAAGVSRRVVYSWLERDKRFRADYQEAELEAIDVLEGAAWKRAVQGVTNRFAEQEYSDTLLIFLLKARDPDKYRQRANVRVTFDVKKEAEKLAKELGLTVDDLLREAGLSDS